MLDTRLHSAASAAPVPPAAGSADIAETVLEQARERARAEAQPYAGGISPADAWTLVIEGRAVLVDVRTAEERKFVGHIPETLHVAWMTGTAMNRNPRPPFSLNTFSNIHWAGLHLCLAMERCSATAGIALCRPGGDGSYSTPQYPD